MIDAKMLATHVDDTALEVWGVWIPRRGDNAIFTVEVVANTFAYFQAELYEKNYEDVGNGTATGQSITFNEAVGRQSLTEVGAKELVRFKVTLQRGASLPDQQVGLVLYRFLQPMWFETVKV